MKKVLVVEDDKALLNIYRKMIGTEYWVEGVGDGQAALRIFEKYTPDLMFLDLEMPKLDGVSVLRELKRLGILARVPVVILSNYSNPKVIQTALELGAKEYIKKEDIEIHEVMTACRKYIGKQ